MKIDVMHALYTGSMIILAFVAALVITKTITKYLEKKKREDEQEE
ncbi:hypothetical protein [Sulfurovum riftiae]|nr:hypothetical protein [Sulfurovum riftiae]